MEGEERKRKRARERKRKRAREEKEREREKVGADTANGMYKGVIGYLALATHLVCKIRNEK